MEEERLKELAVLYKKDTSRPLSKHQLAMNEAAQALALDQPSLIRKRQMLLDLARDRVIASGFQFVKGKSRSKKSSGSEEEPAPKRRKLSQDIREKRMKDLEQDISDLKERIGFKEKRITEKLNVHDYKRCDELKEEVMEVRKKLREAEREKKGLAKASSRAVSYRMQRQNSSSNESDKTITLAPSPSSDVFPQSQSAPSSPPLSTGSSLSGRQLSYSPVEPDSSDADDSEDYFSSQLSQNLI